MDKSLQILYHFKQQQHIKRLQAIQNKYTSTHHTSIPKSLVFLSHFRVITIFFFRSLEIVQYIFCFVFLNTTIIRLSKYYIILFFHFSCSFTLQNQQRTRYQIDFDDRRSFAYERRVKREKMCKKYAIKKQKRRKNRQKNVVNKAST